MQTSAHTHKKLFMNWDMERAVYDEHELNVNVKPLTAHFAATDPTPDIAIYQHMLAPALAGFNTIFVTPTYTVYTACVLMHTILHTMDATIDISVSTRNRAHSDAQLLSTD